MRVALSAAVCAACLVAAPLSAAAPQRVATVTGLTGDLQFAGPRTAWLEQSANSWTVRSAAPGEVPSVLAAGPLVPRSADPDGGSVSFEEVRFASSDRRLALVDRFGSGSGKYMIYVWRANLLSGALGQPLASVEMCSGAQSPIRDLTLDGDVLAYARCESGVGVRDYRPGAPLPSRTFDYQGVAAPEVAGRLLAVGHYVPERSVEEVVLVDWTTGAELLRVDSPTFDFVTDYDVTSDGTLVVARAMGPFDDSSPCLNTKRIVLYTAPSTAERVLPGRPCFGQIAVADGKVAYVAESGPDRMALVAVSFAGEISAIADLGHPQMLTGKIAFDGERAAYALATCDERHQISVAPVAGTPAPEPVGCPVFVSRRAAIRRGQAVVTLRCLRGCSGEARLLRRRRGRARGTVRARTFAFPPSARERALRLPLSRRMRRGLARQRRMRAVLELTTRDRAGPSRVVRRALLISRPAAGP